MSKKVKTIRPKRTFRDRLPLLLAFLVPIFIMLIIFAGKGIYPFGEQSFLRIDLYHQYAPFHTDLLRRLQSGASLTYAWDIGLGSNYVALSAYYLCSPFNLLLFFLPASHITEYIGYMAILKTGLAGLTMAWYLCGRSGKRELSSAFFGICYAMCGYFAAYNWNIMWLDCLWLAPLVILGLERLVKEGRPFLYCITLGLSILTNYYISIMLCLFLVLYFICLMIMVPQKDGLTYLKRIGQFGLFSLIGGGLAAVMLLPAYFALGNTASAWTKTTFPSTLTSYFSMIEMLGRHLTLVECELGLEHWPNIYSGVATLVFVPLYYMNRRVNYKEKIVKTVLLVVLLLSFSFNIPNYIWHGLHYPNSLPCRQSFLYTIILLSMCYEGARGMRGMHPGRLVAVFFGTAAFILIAEKLIAAPEFHYWTFYVSLLFVALYCLFFYLYRTGRLRETMAFILAIIVLVIETGLNTAVTSVTITSRTAYWDHVEDYQTLLDQTGDTDLFYRVDKMSRKSKNDGTFINYNSASIFSSTTHAGISDIYRKLGMEGNTNAYCITGATPFMESMLSVKYRLSLTELPESPLYRLAGSQNNVWLYENLYTLPLGFMINDSTEEAWSGVGNNPAKAQNRLAALLGGSSDLLVQIPGTAQGSEYTTSINERGHVFVFVENSAIDAVDASVNGTEKSFSNVKRRYMLDLGYCNAGTDIRLSTDQDEKMNASVYMFDDQAFIEVYEAMAGGGMQLESFKNDLLSTYVKGTVTAQDGQLLMLSIPFENGWTVKVDGVKTEAAAFSGSFMTVPMSAGEHTVELSYMPEGLKLGALITAGSILLLLVLFVISRIVRRVMKKKAAAENAEQLSFDGDDESLLQLTEDAFETEDEGEIHNPISDTELFPDTDSPEPVFLPEVGAAQILAAEDAAGEEAAPEHGEGQAEAGEEAAADADAGEPAADLKTLEPARDPEEDPAADGTPEAADRPEAPAYPDEPEETAASGEPMSREAEPPLGEGTSSEEEDPASVVARQVAQIMAEPEAPAPAHPAPDPYETRLLEQILMDLEGR